MAPRQSIQPDMDFINEIRRYGGDSLKKCYQCAMCSITCPLTSDENPFPRKEMLWAQWGLKEKLIKDPDIWLCYQCNDCSLQCPRNAFPGNVLSALRNYCFLYYAFPQLLGKAFRDWRYLPLLLGFPVILFILIMEATGHLNFPERAPNGEEFFANFIPHIIINSVFLVLLGIVFVTVAISLYRFWRALRISDKGLNFTIWDVLKKSAVPALVVFLPHTKFNECGGDKNKRIAHMYILYGCLSFVLVSAVIFIGTYIIKVIPVDLPLHMWNPLKIIANLGAFFVLIGCFMVIRRKIKGDKNAGNNSYLDWNLLILIVSITVIGLLTEFTRLIEFIDAAYTLYFIHLVLVFYGILYFPYSKLAHLLYRSIATIYADYRQQYILEDRQKQD